MNIREKIKSYLPFLVLFLLMLAAHGTVSYGRDDVLFRSVLDVTDGLSFLTDRWHNWSSRTIIEGVMIYILDIDRFSLWKWLNCLLFLPLPWVICRLTRKGIQEQPQFHWFVVGLILLYPYGYDMSTSGWAATTMNYFWPLVFALIAILPIRVWLEGGKLRWYAWLFLIPAFLYAANAEQTCVILLAVYIAFFCWQAAVCKKVSPQILVLSGLALLSLSWILCCPGNQVRRAAELYRFTEYPILGFADKLDLALSSTMVQLIGRPNLLFLFFALMLAGAVWKKEQAVFYRLIATFPAACCLVFGIFQEQTTALYPELGRMMEITNQGVITVENYFLYKSYLPLFVMGGVILCVLISFYLIFREDAASGKTPDVKETLRKCPRTGTLAVFTFLLGLASRAMMAFSPTVWASNTRTNIYLDFSVILLCCLLYEETDEKDRQNSKLWWLLGILAVFSYGIQFTAM